MSDRVETTFVDEEGRTWRLKVHVPLAKRVKEETGVDLLSIADGQLVQQLLASPETLVSVLWVLCDQQAGAAGIEPEDFGAAIAGEALDEAVACLIEALCDFFPPSTRAVYRAAAEKVQTTRKRADAAALQALDSPELQRTLDRAIARIGSTFTASAGSSASTPAAAR